MWYFNSPHIIFGEDALTWLSSFKGQRAFLVTDTTMVKLGFVHLVREQIAQGGMETRVFDQVEPEPCMETVKNCARVMQEYIPDWVIGLGGGSCLDTAKAAWFLYERPDVDLEAINPVQNFGLRARAHLIEIPTTSGSGSEATSAVVLRDLTTCRKIELSSQEIIADYAIIDPQFTACLPANLTAETGIDALSHAVEAYTNAWANDFSDGLCLQAVRLVFKYLPEALKDGGGNLLPREKMANAATLAGMSLCNSQIGLAHAMSHSVGAFFPMPHGRIAGLFLPYTIEFTARAANRRYADLARIAGLGVDDERLAGFCLANSIRDLARSAGLPLSLQQAGIPREALEMCLDALCEHALLDIGLITHPRAPNQDELARLFRYSYEGKVVDF